MATPSSCHWWTVSVRCPMLCPWASFLLQKRLRSGSCLEFFGLYGLTVAVVSCGLLPGSLPILGSIATLVYHNWPFPVCLWPFTTFPGLRERVWFPFGSGLFQPLSANLASCSLLPPSLFMSYFTSLLQGWPKGVGLHVGYSSSHGVSEINQLSLVALLGGRFNAVVWGWRNHAWRDEQCGIQRS